MTLTNDQKTQASGLVLLAMGVANKIAASARKSGCYIPQDEVTSRAGLALCQTIGAYKPDRGASLMTWFHEKFARAFIDVCRCADGRRTSRKARTHWVSFGDNPLGEPAEYDVPDRAHRDTPLKVWSDAREERADLEWRGRIFVYLWLVECWTQSAIGQYFGLSEARVSKVATDAIRLLDAASEQRV